MKNYWLLLVLSLALGTTAAWAMNYAWYGHREAYFGELTADGRIDSSNVMAELSKHHDSTIASVEVVNDVRHDFGAMAPNTDGSHEFVFKNTGDAPLELSVGETTCKCTLGTLEKNKIGPGETTTVKMEWSVKTKYDTFEQSAEVITNDPSKPMIRLLIYGRVVREIEFDPKDITFGEVASGDEFEVRTKMYNFMEQDIRVDECAFGSEEMTSLADFEITPLNLEEADGFHKDARQGFNIVAKVKPGLRQGPLTTNLQVSFVKLDESGNPITVAADDESGDPSESKFTTMAQCAGSVVGALRMVESTQIRRISGGGGYIWSLGHIGEDDSLEAKGLVMVKGSQQDNVNLTIGKITPEGAFSAEIGTPISNGPNSANSLFPVTLKFKRQDKLIDLLGKNKDDFGLVWVESDNPKVGRMRIAVKVAIEPNP